MIPRKDHLSQLVIVVADFPINLLLLKVTNSRHSASLQSDLMDLILALELMSLDRPSFLLEGLFPLLNQDNKPSQSPLVQTSFLIRPLEVQEC